MWRLDESLIGQKLPDEVAEFVRKNIDINPDMERVMSALPEDYPVKSASSLRKVVFRQVSVTYENLWPFKLLARLAIKNATRSSELIEDADFRSDELEAIAEELCRANEEVSVTS